MAILTIEAAREHLREDSTDAKITANITRAMAYAEAEIQSSTGRMFDGTNAIAVACALMLLSQFYDNPDGQSDGRRSALDYGVTNLLTKLQYWPDEVL